MKNIISIIVALFLTSCLLTSAVPKSEIKTNANTHYQYKISLASDDWFSYSVLEKSEMLRISKEELEKMSDLQLLYAIADYPYFGDVYAYGFDEEGLARFEKYCSAYAELHSRDSFLDSLNRYGPRVAQEYASRNQDDLDNLRAQLLLDLVSFYHESPTEQYRDTPIIIYTPNGTAVVALQRVEYHTAAKHAIDDQYFVNTYYVTKVYPGTCIYNCHSFAWSINSPSNPYWINYPQAYMTDGSYSLVYSGSTSSIIVSYGASQNDKIFYPNGNHSAILTGNPANGAPLVSLEATSKWGPNGVFKHAVGNVPADYQPSIVSIWH
jgi:hypothetical protein